MKALLNAKTKKCGLFPGEYQKYDVMRRKKSESNNTTIKLGRKHYTKNIPQITLKKIAVPNGYYAWLTKRL